MVVYSLYIRFNDMASRVTRWGNSLGLRIPKPLADQIGLVEGTAVDLSLEGEQIVIKKLAMPSYSLDDLLDEIQDENVHREVTTGRPVGKEVW